jgi:hypothetical protein
MTPWLPLPHESLASQLFTLVPTTPVPPSQVSAKRQKLLGLKTKDGKLAPDAAHVADLAAPAGGKVMMMGQREAAIAATDAAAAAAPEVQDDFDVAAEDEQALDVQHQPEVCGFGFGLVWFGLVWFGLVWFGLVWFGLVWFGWLCLFKQP